MKNLKKLVIASFMLVIAFVAVVSSTYAWFTQGTTAEINDIQIGVVDANKAMLVSTDGTNWSKEIELNYNGKLTPATVMNFTSGELKFQQLSLGNNPLEDSVALPVSNLEEPEVVAEGAEGYDQYLLDKAAYDDAVKTVGGYVKVELYFQVTVNAITDW